LEKSKATLNNKSLKELVKWERKNNYGSRKHVSHIGENHEERNYTRFILILKTFVHINVDLTLMVLITIGIQLSQPIESINFKLTTNDYHSNENDGLILH
jgi:hypothetical protein